MPIHYAADGPKVCSLRALLDAAECVVNAQDPYIADAPAPHAALSAFDYLIQCVTEARKQPRVCLDCPASLSQYSKAARRCRTCSAVHRHTLAAATTRKRRPVTAKQIVEYLAENAPKSYQSIVAKILEAR